MGVDWKNCRGHCDVTFGVADVDEIFVRSKMAEAVDFIAIAMVTTVVVGLWMGGNGKSMFKRTR